MSALIDIFATSSSSTSRQNMRKTTSSAASLENQTNLVCSPSSPILTALEMSESNQQNQSPFTIRFLVFIEAPNGTRSNIFDSQKYSSDPTTSTSPLTTPLTRNNKSKVLYGEMLSRMIFGSSPMVVSNRDTIKVHSLRSSNKTMISSVFNYYNSTPVHNNNSQSSTRHLRCACKHKQSVKPLPAHPHRRRGDSLSHFVSSDSTNKSGLTINNNNSKPIDILLSQSLTGDTKPADLDNLQTVNQQSSCSSLVSSNSNSNFNSPCSSVPTHYGSYSGVYKRLMRSVSNSLISSTSTEIPHDQSINISENGSRWAMEEDSVDLSETGSLTDRTNTVGSFKNGSGAKHSFSSRDQENSSSQPWICEKCIDKNRYPKYKIGMAVMFCLPPPSPSPNHSSASSSTPSSPRGTSNNPSLPSSPTQQSQKPPIKQTLQKQDSYDQILMFPSSPPTQPSSPALSTFIKKSSISEAAQLPTHPTTKTNESFYEFFFSHLPIIECQIKELKHRLIANLPFFFHPALAHNHSQRISIPIQQTKAKPVNFNSSCPVDQQNTIPNERPITTANLFATQLLTELNDYKRRFQLLYISPRLDKPAWLTINRQNCNNKTNYNSELSDKLVSEIIFLDKVKKTGTTKPSSLPFNLNIRRPSHQQKMCNQSNGSSGFFNSLRNSLVKEKFFFSNNSVSSSPTKTSSTSLAAVASTNMITDSFLATLISTILKHHHSWVYTVLPSTHEFDTSISTSTSANGNNKSFKKNSQPTLRKQRAHWTSILEKTNPYNPLWAQLGDLHGAVNHPLRLVRCVVVGQNQAAVEKVLHLLSYFIRCGNSMYYDIAATEGGDGLLELNKSGEVDNSACKLNEMNLDSKGASVGCNGSSKEINVFELGVDPMAQFTAVMAATSVASPKGTSSGDDNLGRRKKNRTNNEDINCISSISSSSSNVTHSLSSCSVSSSPLPQSTIKLTTNKSENDTSNHILQVSFQPNATPTISNLSSNCHGLNCTAQELPLLTSQLVLNPLRSTRIQDNFGYSLIASYCPEFVFEFVLHGTPDKSFIPTLYDRLKFSKAHSIIDCPLEESIYIVVDMDELDVRVYSSEDDKHDRFPIREKPVDLVDSMLVSVLNMIRLFKGSEFVLLHLEDKLQELYNKAMTLKALKSQSNSCVDEDLILDLMDLKEASDLEFLNGILQAVDIPSQF